MTIRVRLILSYLAMLIVPIALGFVALLIIFVANWGELKDLRSFYNIDRTDGGQFGNPFQDWKDRMDRVAGEIRGLAGGDAAVVLDRSRQEAWDARLNEIRTALVVRQDEDFVYVSPYFQEPGLLEQLPPYGIVYSDRQNHSMLQGQRIYAFSRDELIAGQSRVTVFYITDTGPLHSIAKRFTAALLLSLLLILVLTNGVLTWLVSRSITRPLKALTEAANRIRRGDLDFTVKPGGRDEIGVLCVAFEDMRARLKQSVELQMQYEENRKELVSHISHDLRTPVTAIKGYVEGIMDGVADKPDKREKYMRTIYRKAVDLDRLIDELFLYSKLDLNRVPFDFESVDPARFIADIVEEFRFETERSGVALELDSQLPPGVRVVIDREKMKRVVANILDNAVKYMDRPDGRIAVRLSVDAERRVLVRIEDNGRGIETQALPFVFEQFYRAESSRSRDTGGSGLGLAIAKQIVEGHGGQIGADSAAGQGTCIWIRLEQAEERRAVHEPDSDH